MAKPETQSVEKTTAKPAFSVGSMETLKKRADFLKAAKAKRQHAKGFVLQCRKRAQDEAPPELIRVGYTCSKKVGNAVARNRAKRRLREIAAQVIPFHGKIGHDYVLIGRTQITAQREFEQLKQDLVEALSVLHP